MSHGPSLSCPFLRKAGRAFIYLETTVVCDSDCARGQRRLLFSRLPRPGDPVNALLPADATPM